jgi:hypothetical protein
VSATLVVELETGAIERARADLVIVSFTTTERPLRGAAGRADWRLCGRLSRLIAEGRVHGHAGEAVLLPGGGGLRAPLLLALGRGPAASPGPAAAAAFARDAVGRGLALRAEALVLALPASDLGDLALRPCLEAIIAGAGDALAAQGAGASLRLVLLGRSEEGPRLLEALRVARPAGFPASVSLRLPGAASRRAGTLPATPRGAAGARPLPFK